MELNHMRFPTLKSLTVVVSDAGNASHLRETLRHFDTPLLSSLVVQYTHADQICALFNPTSHLSFPALTSLSFIHRVCGCESTDIFQSIPSPPLHLFPILSSLTLINQCLTKEIISDILGPNSQPWPSFKTVSICPQSYKSDDVYPTDCGFEAPTRPSDPCPPASPRAIFQRILGRERGGRGIV
ncbi:hypothetical protein DFH07DRAFT_811499 [Mycena maculata]|uniref:Uncharacterized protein n=1 Tax=Mycena maculata TaxID=230809 RepID=A0AAD7NKN1_9AGAR|nr:hypothetical protein DFH07DRAFT_811499 [Mycena maculata]